MDSSMIEKMREDNPFLSLNDAVYEILRQEIVSFQFHPKSRLKESTLAAELGISRSPVKLALEKLEAKGFVQSVPNKGYAVSPFSLKDYKCVMDLAMLIEPYAAGQTARIITSWQLASLYSMAQEMKAVYEESAKKASNLNYSKLMDLEYRFHTSIVEMANNALLNEVYNDIRDKLMRYRCYLVYNPPEGMYEALGADHIVICDALRLKDRDIAEATMRRHLSISKNKFKNQIIFEKYEDKESS